MELPQISPFELSSPISKFPGIIMVPAASVGTRRPGLRLQRTRFANLTVTPAPRLRFFQPVSPAAIFPSMKKSRLFAACLLLAGGLSATAQTDPALQQNMIWTEAAPTSEGEPIFVAFRKTFALAAQPKTAELRIFADLRYQLWVNGRYVVRGPVRFDPKAPQFDVLDIASYLQPGANTLAVMVLGRAATTP